MVNCAVPSCKNDSRRQTKQKSNITFHRFPKNEELLRKWVDALQRPDWEPTIRSFVCSMHFPEASMYFSKSGLRKLIQDAVPELYLDNKLLKKKPKTKSSKIIFKETKKRKNEISLDNVKKEQSPLNDASPADRKLKKRIMNLTKLSKRRRLRCNALYASLNRIRKKVTTLTGALKDLQQRISENLELGRVMETYGVSPRELFQGLGNKERSYSPETQEEFFYSEIPNNIETFVESETNQKKQITIYTNSFPSELSPPPELDVEVSVVKTESSSPRREGDVLEPVFVDMSAVCRVCLLSNVTMHCIDDELRSVYEKLAGAKVDKGGRGALCQECRDSLQRCQRFAEMARKAERYRHTQEAVNEVREE